MDGQYKVYRPFVGREYTIRINNRIYVTTSTDAAWLFACIFNACSMVSRPYTGFEMPKLMMVTDDYKAEASQ